jgi:putative DNA primase/helicase
MYVANGDNQGIYSPDLKRIKQLIKRFNYTISDKDIKQVLNAIELEAPVKTLTIEPDYVPVKNGIFNYKTKELFPYSEEYVFMSKSPVCYNPLAVSPTFINPDGTVWEVEAWIKEIADNEEVEKLLWQIISACLRRFVNFDKIVLLKSSSGCNGKGCTLTLCRNLIGNENCVSLPLNKFSNRFALSGLIGKSAIITDENPTNIKVTDSSSIKAIVTHDVIDVERKYSTSVSYRFFGLVIECVNSEVEFGDSTESNYRRTLYVPFSKTFVNTENKAIKQVYLHDERVLEFVLKKALESNFYEFDEPACCKYVKEEEKLYNNEVLDFFVEIEPQLAWSLIPYQFVYDLYCAWHKKNAGDRPCEKRAIFIKELKQVIDTYYDDKWEAKDTPVRSAGRMMESEPLIAFYNVVDWKSSTYNGGDPNKIGMPCLNEFYRGLLIRDTYVPSGNDTTGSDE